MSTKQYTIRNMPPKLDRVLRKRAQITGKSLNQLIIEDISAQNNISLGSDSSVITVDLDWFIGSDPLEPAVVKSIEDNDAQQKRLMRKELESNT